MHGAHKSRNVLRGKYHPKFKNGDETLEARFTRSENSAMLLNLRDIGDSIGMFNGSHVRGRKPSTYTKYDMNDPEQLAKAIIKTLKKP